MAVGVENWLPVQDFPLYEVSDGGRVRRADTKRLLHPFMVQRYFRISVCRDGKRVGSRQVHHLVLFAFQGPPLNGQVARHLDGDRFNNRNSNLAWGTRIENEEDKLRHGRRLIGEKHHQAKLNNFKVRCIRALLKQNVSRRKIANLFGIDRHSVYSIHWGKTWGRV